MPIDFNQFKRGQAERRRALEEANRFKANESTYALQELNNIYAMQDLNIGRQAAAYVAPLATHRQRAAQQGADPIDFLVQQQQAMINDPNFQGFSPDVQQAVNEKFQQQVTATAETLIRNKDFSGLQRLVDTLGVVSPVGSADQASMTGNTADLFAALAMQGVPAEVTPDGNIMVNGMEIEPNKLNALYSQYNGNVAMMLNAYQQELAQAEQTNRANQFAAGSATIGSVLGSDGNYYNATTGNLSIDKQVAESMGLPVEGGTYNPRNDKLQGVDVATALNPSAGLPPASEPIAETQPVVNLSEPATTGVTGLDFLTEMQSRLDAGDFNRMTVDELNEVANAPSPSARTILNEVEFAAYQDPRTPPAEKAALREKLIASLQSYGNIKQAATLAKDAATPKPPRPEEFFSPGQELTEFNNLITALTSGVVVSPESVVAKMSDAFKAKLAAFEDAQLEYRKTLE